MIHLILSGFLASLDLLIKTKIERKYKDDTIKPYCGGRVLLRKYHNTGAMLNLGSKVRPLVAGISVLFTGLVGIWLLLLGGTRGQQLLKAGLTLLLGGGFSNTYDRLRRGYVVDYFSLGVKWEPLRRVVFNLGDFFIFLGAVFTAIACGGR